MMGLQIFLVFVVFSGMVVNANRMERCMELVDLEDELDSVMVLEEEQQMEYVCTNLTSFLRCVNEATKAETGLNLRELADLLKDTNIGKALTLFVNLADVVEELCTEGTELRNEYLENAHCYSNMDRQITKECQKQAKDAFEDFRDAQSERSPNRSRRDRETEEPCVVTAYVFGCLGAAVHEECGDQGFKTYKDVVRKIGFFKSGICSSELVHTIKGSFLDNLSISESRKSLYRVILDLKRRRK